MKTKTILVVDDNPFIARLIEDALHDVPGYRAVTAGDGTTALELITAAPPDLIILDVHIPRMSGFDLYDQIRRNGVTAAIPVLLMSAAMPHPELARRGLTDYLRKPFSMEDLLERVHNALQRSRPIH